MAFNKMFVMLPVMLAARKLDGENPDTVFLLRCAYGTVQAVIVLLVAYIYISSQAVSNGKDKDRLIYVPPPPVVSFLCVSIVFSFGVQLGVIDQDSHKYFRSCPMPAYFSHLHRCARALIHNHSPD